MITTIALSLLFTTIALASWWLICALENRERRRSRHREAQCAQARGWYQP